MRALARLVALATLTLFCVGCSDPPQFRLNQVEWLKFQYQKQAKGDPVPAGHQQEVVDVLAALFGTPDEPHFPFLLGAEDPAHDILKLENLQRAAGPVSSNRKGDQRGLYREHCAQCHGISGDGAGPTSAFLNPYPRDFRLGKFKFKSTKLGDAPTDEDLRRILVNGIPGSAMPSFRTLKDDELGALVDYVKYLAIRGRVESKLLEEVTSLEPGETLIDLDWRKKQANFVADPGSAANDPARRKYDDQISMIVEDIFFDVVDHWLKRKQTNVPEVPAWLSNQDSEYSDRVAQGRALFTGKANCALCHGLTGLGDGQTENYDDWTTEWVKKANVDPRDPVACAPFIERGAFPPRAIRPRNLRMRVYRGGDRYVDVYRRIANGIEGTGMPDSSVLNEQEIWSLVAYVFDLPYESNGGSPGAQRSAKAPTEASSASPQATPATQ